MSTVYRNYKSRLLTDLQNGTVKVMLTNNYTPLQTHQFKSDVTNEASGTGYTAGGATLTSKTVTVNTTTNIATFSCANPVWVNTSITFNGFVMYIDSGTASTSPLVGYFPVTGGSKTFTNESFTIDVSGMAGLLDLS
jgi:hypothetical protein